MAEQPVNDAGHGHGPRHAGEHWAPPRHWGQHAPGWQRKRRFLLRRLLAVIFGLITLVVGGMALLAFLLTRLFDGSGPEAVLVWLGGCTLAIAIPLTMIALGMRAYRRYASPLADVMAAADAVADGDLSVRVSEQAPGEFGGLARSFNRMAGELERNDRQRRNLTADVAHELRTPLHIIQGNLEGIIDGVYEPTPDHLEATLDETRTLARIVTDLQTLAQAEAGELTYAAERVPVDQLLADLETSFAPWAETKGVDLTVIQLGGDPPLCVHGDAGRLDQVLSNLTGNAIRHTPPGGAIRITAEQQEEMIRIVVADSGEGIAPEDLPYIFDRFWRGDRARTRQEGSGSGLGLAIAKQIVKQHGGNIQVTSRPETGTRFTVSLPVPPK